MPRNGAGVYSKVPGTAAVPGQTVASDPYNQQVDDAVNDANTPRPIVAGGTGENNAVDALAALGGLPTDPDLVSIAALGYSARSTLVKTAANTWSLVPQTAFGDTLLAAADAAAGRTALVLGNVDNTSDAVKNAAAVTLTNKTLTSPVINSPTGIVKGDVGLGNVDNTSDATKNAAAVTLTNKALSAPTITMANNVPINLNETGGSARPGLKMDTSNNLEFGNVNINAEYLCYTHSFYGAGVLALEVTAEADTRIKLVPTALAVNSAGFRGAPQNDLLTDGNVTLALSDAGGSMQKRSSSARNLTIPPNSSVAFPVGTVILIYANDNSSGSISVVEGSGVTLYRGDGTSGTGTRIVPQHSMASIYKRATNEWVIAGSFT